MKIGAIGIRTKIIVGDAATWYLVKKYLDNVVIKGGITPEERAKLAEYPEFEDMATKEYVDEILGDINTALETILAIEV